jgi:two-component system heavy metal sensor histidine kinase CusS
MKPRWLEKVRLSVVAVRRSMTVQISLAIAVVSVLMIMLFGRLLDEFLARERREETELQLISTLAYFRDDIAGGGNTPTAAVTLLERAVRRTARLDAALLDGTGKILSEVPRHVIPESALPQTVLDTDSLPANASLAQLASLRERLGPVTALWTTPTGTRVRLIRGKIPLRGAGEASELQVVLAIETRPTRELRERNRQTLAAALWAAAALASLFGVWIAHRIVVSVRRLGATASRIGSTALGERLRIEETPTELVESAVAFNQMLDRLQSSIERLSDFSSELAHDLRTPIGNLLGEAEVVLSRPRSADEYRAALESAVEEYERLSRMISNMLFLARADNETATLAPEWVDVGGMLRRVTGYFALLAEEHGCGLSIQMDSSNGSQPRVWADESLLLRALSNLVANALRYADPGSEVCVRLATHPDGDCELHVANEGSPIPAEHHSRIFDRFYRVEPSRHGSASGSGLGLAIVRSIMGLHGGRVSLRSEAGEATVFTLHFPGETASASAGRPK